MPKIGIGCIFQATTKSGKTVWKVEVTTGYDYRGKRKRTRRTAHSSSEAIKIHRSMIAQLEQGKLGNPKTELFGIYADWWLEFVKSPRVRISTASDYRDRLIRDVYPYFKTKRMDAITAHDIEEWIGALIAKGKSTSSINGAKQVLGAVLGHAHRSSVIPNNPASSVARLPRRFDEPSHVKEPWTKDEALAALEASRNGELDLFIHLALHFGLRRGEILGLKWEDFNFHEGSLQIRRTLKEQRVFHTNGASGRELVTSQTKTRSSSRKLYLTTPVMQSVQRHREQLRTRLPLSRQNEELPDFVFAGRTGKPLFPSNVGKEFARFCTNNRLRRIRIHDMRHTAAVLAISSGVRLEAVSQGLGHSRIDITKSVYAPYVQPVMDEFTIGLASFLNPSKPEEINTLEALSHA